MLFFYSLALPQALWARVTAFCGLISLKLNGSSGQQARQAVKCEAAELEPEPPIRPVKHRLDKSATEEAQLFPNVSDQSY